LALGEDGDDDDDDADDDALLAAVEGLLVETCSCVEVEVDVKGAV